MIKKVYKILDYNSYCKKILLDDNTFFKLSNKLVRLNCIKEEKEIVDFDEILHKCIYVAIRHKIIELLSKKDYSKKEILAKMYSYGYSNIYAEPIIDELTKKGYVDDKDYCLNLINSYSKKYGVHKIKAKLYEKGIEKEVISECLREVELGSYDVILKYLQKYDYKDLTEYKERQKIVNKLIYRGFELQDINYAIEDVVYELQSLNM